MLAGASVNFAPLLMQDSFGMMDDLDGNFAPLNFGMQIDEPQSSCSTGQCPTDTATSGEAIVVQKKRRRRRKKNEMDYVKHITGIDKLVGHLGLPDVTDRKHGGIAIWAKPTLKERGYSFLSRVEIIDEAVPSSVPVRHYSNVYLWIPMNPNNEQLAKILSLSKNFYFDRKKQLMVVRSCSLNKGIAQAAVLRLYINGRFSFYQVVNNELLMVFYTQVCHKTQRRAIYSIMNAIQ